MSQGFTKIFPRRERHADPNNHRHPPEFTGGHRTGDKLKPVARTFTGGQNIVSTIVSIRISGILAERQSCPRQRCRKYCAADRQDASFFGNSASCP